MLFICMKPLDEVIHRFGLDCRQYADDTLLYLTLPTDPREAVESPNQCLEVVLEWIWVNKLMLNHDKMEVLLMSGRSDLGLKLSPILDGVEQLRQIALTMITNLMQPNSLFKNRLQMISYMYTSLIMRHIHIWVQYKMQYLESKQHSLCRISEAEYLLPLEYNNHQKQNSQLVKVPLWSSTCLCSLYCKSHYHILQNWRFPFLNEGQGNQIRTAQTPMIEQLQKLLNLHFLES